MKNTPPARLEWLPAENAEASALTGYARSHWEAAADHLVNSAWKFSSPAGATLDLPGAASGNGRHSDGLEGFARSFLLAAFRVAGAGGQDPHGWLPKYARGLAAGTASAGSMLPDGSAAEPWPAIGSHYSGGQPLVESASIALALRMTRPWLWDKLPVQVQEQAAGWLRSALDAVPAPNNWHLFGYAVAGFLESAGFKDEATSQARWRAETLLDSWYQGQGWYSDGEGRAYDYYNGWALHFYPALDAWLAERENPRASRLKDHLDAFKHWFSTDGSPVYFGRSMTYRWTAGTAIAVGELSDSTSIPPGQARTILSSMLKYFLEHEAVNEQGLLVRGWHGESASAVQDYSGPASPLWAAKAFSCLLIPADAPFWTDPEIKAPAQLEDTVLAEPVPGFLLQSTCSDGIVRLHNHGSDKIRPYQESGAANADPHYSRLAYSSATAPLPMSGQGDNSTTVIWRGNRSVRRRIEPLGAGSSAGWGWAASRHIPVFAQGSPSIPGLVVDDYVIASGDAEVRLQVVGPSIYPVKVEHAGWAVPQDGSLSSSLEPLHGYAPTVELRTVPGGTVVDSCPADVPVLSAGQVQGGIFAGLARLGGAGAEATGVSGFSVDGNAVEFAFERAGQLPVRLRVDVAAQQVQEVQA